MSDNNAFTAETAAQHQAELNDYLQSKNINQLFIQIVESLLIEKPDNPIGFIVQFLQKKYPDQAMVSGPPAIEVGNIIANSSKPQTHQAAAADPDEEEDEDDEDDEDDYIDDLPIAKSYQEKGVKAKRMSIMSESPTNMSTSDIVKIDKSPAEKQAILNTLATCVLFKHLEGTQLDTLADAMEMKTFQEGELIIQEGDDGDFFYVVDKGVIDCYKADKKIYTYQNEGSFGELAIMYNAPRAATCKARTQASLWALERKAFKTILMTSTMEKRNKYKEFLSAVEMLSELNEYEVLTIADSLNEETHADQSVLCRQGEAGDTFYIVKEGTAVCYQTDAAGNEIEVARLSVGSYFGEIALLTSKPRQATVKADGPLSVLSLDRKTFKRVMGPMEQILQRNMAQYTKIAAGQI